MSFDRPRELTDPKAMRAMAHPVRLALLEALADAGTLTATEAGEKVGESPANASFHLRQLAKYGFVVEAEGGTGRKRPWKLAPRHELHRRPRRPGDGDRRADAGSGPRDRYLARARRLRGRPAQPKEWRAVTGMNQMGLYLTAEELERVNEEIVELLFDRYADRRTPSPDQPEGAERVEILTLAYRAMSRDTRLFLTGQSLSLLGDTALWLALGLWVKDLTGSSSAAGLVILCIVAPQLASPFAGLLVDRVRRRTLLLVVNPLTALAVLPLLAVHDRGDIWIIYAVAAAYGASYVVLSAGQSALLHDARAARAAREGQRDAANGPRGAAADHPAGRRRPLHARGRRRGRPAGRGDVPARHRRAARAQVREPQARTAHGPRHHRRRAPHRPHARPRADGRRLRAVHARDRLQRDADLRAPGRARQAGSFVGVLMAVQGVGAIAGALTATRPRATASSGPPGSA